MKKLLTLGMLLGAIIIASMAPVGTAYAASGRTYITGVVSDIHGNPIAGAFVVATCGRWSASPDYSSETGAYLIEYVAPECGWDSSIELSAEKDGHLSWDHGITQKINSKLSILNMNIVILKRD